MTDDARQRAIRLWERKGVILPEHADAIAEHRREDASEPTDRGPERPERCKMLTDSRSETVTFFADESVDEWIRCHEDLPVVIGQ